jgi:hypothetical protein
MIYLALIKSSKESFQLLVHSDGNAEVFLAIFLTGSSVYHETKYFRLVTAPYVEPFNSSLFILPRCFFIAHG